MSDEWPPRKYRTWSEAESHLPVAHAILDAVRARIPEGWIEIHEDTLFVGTEVPELVACVAVTVPGAPQSLAPLEFELDSDPEETIAEVVDRLMRWHDTVTEHGLPNPQDHPNPETEK